MCGFVCVVGVWVCMGCTGACMWVCGGVGVGVYVWCVWECTCGLCVWGMYVWGGVCVGVGVCIYCVVCVWMCMGV